MRNMAVVMAAATLAVACSTQPRDGPDAAVGQSTAEVSAVTRGSMTAWMSNVQGESFEVLKAIVSRFVEESGIEVEIIRVPEAELPAKMAEAAASGGLPDVVLHPADFSAAWAERGWLDHVVAGDVVDELGVGTFSPSALRLVEVDGGVAAVPSHAWRQVLLYRSDWFSAAGLAPPTTLEQIEAAAQRFHDPALGISGIALANDLESPFTQQSFEHVALANNCRLLGDDGEPALDSSECREALEFYAHIVADLSPGGVQDADSTRAAYFAGEAAMLVWSSFIFGSLANPGAEVDRVCSVCVEDRTFLVRNSGVVSALSGPSGGPDGYGQVWSLGIGAGSFVEAAKAFISFWLEETYPEWLRLNPGGRIPMRTGPLGSEGRYTDEWRTFWGRASVTEAGSVFPPEVPNALAEAVVGFGRWGLTTGGADLVGIVYEELPVAEAIDDVVNDRISVDNAADALNAELSDRLAALRSSEG